MSALKPERVAASSQIQGPAVTFQGDRSAFIEAVRKALYASKICSYAQGFSLMKTASEEYGWDLKLGNIAMIFRGGCIIRPSSCTRSKMPLLLTRTSRTSCCALFQEYARTVPGAWREVSPLLPLTVSLSPLSPVHCPILTAIARLPCPLTCSRPARLFRCPHVPAH
jgi:6-phosphogluconate dehydrogenase